MAVLSAQTIRALCTSGGRTVENCPILDMEWWLAGRVLVAPFSARTPHRGKTFGLGPAGKDVRIAESLWLWPFWGRLASTLEVFDTPRDVTFLVQDKSSWARRFVFAMNTNAEPGWRGYLTLELVRFLPWPVRIHSGSAIANIMFLKLDKMTEQPYAGRYQDQESGPQPARDLKVGGPI